MNFLIFHESVHIIVALLISSALYLRYKNLKLVLIALIVSIFLDIDHLIDYLNYAIATNNFSFPFATDYFHGSDKVIVLFHGWEWVPVLWVIGKKLGKKNNIRGLEWWIVFPYLGHLLVDQFSYTSNPFAYFLTFRILTGFNIRMFNSLL